MFIFPVKTDVRLRSVPWANWLLIAANFAVYLMEVGNFRSFFVDWALNSQRPELHQFITYAFKHSSAAHIIGNMLFLYIFGNNICDKLGNLAYLGFYLGGAIFAGVGYVAINQTGMVVGASGAVAAVTGAYLALMPRSHITLFYWVFILMGLYELPSLWFIAIFFLQDVYFSFSRDSNVAHIAHVGGSIFGLLVGLLLLKLTLLPRDQIDLLGMLDRWNRRRQYQAAVRNGFAPFDYTVSRQQNSSGTPASPSTMEKTQELRAQISESIAHGDLASAGESYKQLRQLDPAQTLSRSSQLDIANHFYSIQDYTSAVAAYELFLKNYASSDQLGQVYLMLGMAYGRHLGDLARARDYLLEAVRLLEMCREQEIAKSELMRLETLIPPPMPRG